MCFCVLAFWPIQTFGEKCPISLWPIQTIRDFCLIMSWFVANPNILCAIMSWFAAHANQQRLLPHHELVCGQCKPADALRKMQDPTNLKKWVPKLCHWQCSFWVQKPLSEGNINIRMRSLIHSIMDLTWGWSFKNNAILTCCQHCSCHAITPTTFCGALSLVLHGQIRIFSTLTQDLRPCEHMPWQSWNGGPDTRDHENPDYSLLADNTFREFPAAGPMFLFHVSCQLHFMTSWQLHFMTNSLHDNFTSWQLHFIQLHFMTTSHGACAAPDSLTLHS